MFHNETPASLSIFCPSSSLVPVNLITRGTLRFEAFKTSNTPLATSSARVIPPRTFKNTVLTSGSDITIFKALAMFSCEDPPPISEMLLVHHRRVSTYPFHLRSGLHHFQ